MANITVEQLEQKYKLDLELMENRMTVKQYQQVKLSNVVKKDNYTAVIAEIEANPTKRTLQALGTLRVTEAKASS